MKRAPARQAPLPAKTLPLPPRQLTPAELREAARNVEFMRAERANWKVGDTRDAEVTCRCGEPKIAELVEYKGKRWWETRCLVCRPRENI